MSLMIEAGFVRAVMVSGEVILGVYDGARNYRIIE